MTIIGRKEEIECLNRAYLSKKAELVVACGRKGVGKTFLINEVFKDKLSFSYLPIPPNADGSSLTMKSQIDYFCSSLQEHGARINSKPSNWFDAFLLLELFLSNNDKKERQVVFFDEISWLDTPKSGFLSAFESFWNGWGCHRENLMVLISSSSSYWIKTKIIGNCGGLYDRLTCYIDLNPFTLRECEIFYLDKDVHLSRSDILRIYMIFGGVPYYLGFIKNKCFLRSLDSLPLRQADIFGKEYEKLFSYSFLNSESAKKIMNILSLNRNGLKRKEILAYAKKKDGQWLKQGLDELIANGFILSYVPYGLGKTQRRYKISDSFCNSYLMLKRNNSFCWLENSKWQQLAFENACFNHVKQIKFALGISGVITESSAWSKRGDEEDGTQIDLLLKRNDNVINMCEIKYYSGDFKVNKDYYKKLLGRQSLLSESVPKKMAIYNTLITTFGLVKNEYSGIFKNVITLDDLFTD